MYWSVLFGESWCWLTAKEHTTELSWPLAGSGFALIVRRLEQITNTKATRKGKSWSKDLRSQLWIELGTSRTEGLTLTNCGGLPAWCFNQLLSQEANRVSQSLSFSHPLERLSPVSHVLDGRRRETLGINLVPRAFLLENGRDPGKALGTRLPGNLMVSHCSSVLLFQFRCRKIESVWWCLPQTAWTGKTG